MLGSPINDVCTGYSALDRMQAGLDFGIMPDCSDGSFSASATVSISLTSESRSGQSV